MAYDFDLFVIGGGSGGVRCARIAAGHGARVAVAEERFWGGTCVNVGCVPKKIMVNAAEYGLWIEDAAAFGWTVQKGPHNWEKLAAVRDAEVQRLSGLYRTLLENAGCTVFECRAGFVDEHTLQVGESRVTAARIVIATGGRAVKADVPGAELGLISDDVFTMRALPRRIAVLGSGYIAVEFAGVYHGLGAEVDLIYRADLPLRGFDQDIRAALREAYDAAQGIRLHPGQQPAAIERRGGSLVVRTQKGAEIETDCVLFATGLLGVLIRRNFIIVLMSVEIMLNAANINLVAFSHYLESMQGQIVALFIIAIAAGEAAIGLAIIIVVFRGKISTNVDEMNLLKW